MGDRDRDLVTEIYRASNRDADALSYLRKLTQQQWEQDSCALASCLQEYPYRDCFDGFCEVVVIAGEHGTKLLREYLASSSGPSRSAAARVVRKIGGEAMRWAIPLLEQTAADTSFDLHTRNQAARIAAELAGRPAPEPFEDVALPATPEALQAALEELPGSQYDQRKRAQDCAASLGTKANEICGRYLARWLREDVPAYQFKVVIRGCIPFERALLALLREPNELFEKALGLAREVFYSRDDLVEFFEQLLREEDDDERVAQIAYTLATVTGESWIADLDNKNSETRKLARESLATLDAKYVRRHVLTLLDAIVCYEGLHGWRDEVHQIINALNRVADIGPVLIAAFETEPDDRYWRCPPRTQKRYLVGTVEKIRDSAPDMAWASTVLQALQQSLTQPEADQ